MQIPTGRLFRAPEPGRSDDVFWYAETLGHELDDGLLTIARDGLGDLYVLDACSRNVWYFHSGDGSRSEVASSFSDLLDRAEIEIDARTRRLDVARVSGQEGVGHRAALPQFE